MVPERLFTSGHCLHPTKARFVALPCRAMSIRWGILGCGDVCEVKSGPGLQRASGSELFAVMRRDRKLAEDFARRHGVPAFYDDAERLIADPNVDAVYIAAPPGKHLEL